MINIPFQKEILEHQKRFPIHTNFSIHGTNKREKMRFPFCNDCKKILGPIQVLSSRKRRTSRLMKKPDKYFEQHREVTS